MSDDAVLAAARLNLPPSPKIILMAIAELCEKNINHCSATIKKISDISGCSAKTVSRQLNWLEENGFIRRSKDLSSLDRTNRLGIPLGHSDAMDAAIGSNRRNVARARLRNKQPTTPVQASPSLSDSFRILTLPELKSSISQEETPSGMNGKKNGHTVMKKSDGQQIDAFNGHDLGIQVRGKRWRETDRIPLDWLHAAAVYLEKETKYARINLRAEAAKFENYWCSKTGKGAAKINWQRTWMNWAIAAAQRAGHRERDGQLSGEGYYHDDSDYGIGYRP